jgi:hypothetical protein
MHAIGARSSDRTDIVSKGWLRLSNGSGPGVEVIFLDADDHELVQQQRLAGHMMWWDRCRRG